MLSLDWVLIVTAAATTAQHSTARLIAQPGTVERGGRAAAVWRMVWVVPRGSGQEHLQHRGKTVSGHWLQASHSL